MIKKICHRCKSDDILADAYARWNPRRNEYDINNVFPEYYCNNCNMECKTIDVETKDYINLVCKKCGGINIMMKAWIDPNTNHYKEDCEGDVETWCDDCQEHDTGIVFGSEYFKKLDISL